MSKFTVLSPVNYDGELYEIDSEIELSAKAAVPLLEMGAVREIAATADKKKKPSGDK